MRYKTEVDQQVAFLLGMRLNHIRTITKMFVEQLCQAIAEDGEVNITGLGTFRIRRVVTEGGLQNRSLMEKRYVRFSKSLILKRVIKETEMEKYGVDERSALPEDFEKGAQEKETCPKCGTRVERHGRILKCPKCGTEPFEE